MAKITIGEKTYTGNYMEKPLSFLKLNPTQPRGDEIPPDSAPFDQEQYLKTPKMKQLINAIIGNGGIIEPLWIEPDGKLVDGHRRRLASRDIVNRVLTTNIKTLAKLENNMPCFVFDKPLTEEERLSIWINIHKTRKDWNAKQKQDAVMRAIKLYRNSQKVSEITGETVRSVEKIMEVYDLSRKLKVDKSVSYAREYLNLSKHIRNDELEKKIIHKINSNIIRSPLEIRKLRKIVTSTEAMKEFLKNGTKIDTAVQYVEPTSNQKLTELAGMIKKIDEATHLTKCPYCNHDLP
jgi:ParB family chromosome partitioning protein